ncbi:MAG TPA: hypothetical protein VKB41_17240 [Steroidobacteraceae bacterium]|jgi:hypothetical protein|nr:hypothetical protein [Steroidobacteraceae bacterium]
MQNDKTLFDWTLEYASRPTWLEVIASHAQILAASEESTGLFPVGELRQAYAGHEAD